MATEARCGGGWWHIQWRSWIYARDLCAGFLYKQTLNSGSTFWIRFNPRCDVNRNICSYGPDHWRGRRFTYEWLYHIPRGTCMWQSECGSSTSWVLANVVVHSVGRRSCRHLLILLAAECVCGVGNRLNNCGCRHHRCYYSNRWRCHCKREVADERNADDDYLLR